MDQSVIRYYRRLLKEGFEHAGSLENPSIFLNSVGEKIRICQLVSNAYVNLYINIRGQVIEEIKYMCTCDPMTNVVIEILCSLVKGKTIADAQALTEASFSRALEGHGEKFPEKAEEAIKLLNRGLSRYESAVS